jgi:hypothetical protein
VPEEKDENPCSPATAMVISSHHVEENALPELDDETLASIWLAEQRIASEVSYTVAIPWMFIVAIFASVFCV